MKKSLEKSLIDQLTQNKMFEHYDFSINENYRAVTINYDYSSEEYCFSFKIPTQSKKVEVDESNTNKNSKSIRKNQVDEIYEFSGYMKPGRYSENESFTVETFEDLLIKLSNWLKYLNQELSESHIYRQIKKQDEKIDEIKKKIEEHFKEQNNNDDKVEEYLTRDEANDLIERLNEIEKVIKEKLYETIELETERDEEIEKLHNEFDDFRDATTYMNKENWFKKFLVSVATWSFDPQNKKKLIAGSSVLLKIGKYFGLPIPDEIIQLMPPSDPK
ncbi:hypothetical protein [Fusibacter bizertensis]